jgi:hypothetical protein
VTAAPAPSRLLIAGALVAGAVVLASGQAPPPIPGLTAGDLVARTYDLVLNADFDKLPQALPTTCPPAPRVACQGLEALGLWWQILLDPASRVLDDPFRSRVDAAILQAERWTIEESSRAEAWFYLGASLGVRAQWKVLREDRLSAARDGKRIKEALERALALDPQMHDAEFGIGMYKYYAAITPAYLRWLRWLFLLPGGNREEGLEQLHRASRQGQLVRGEAEYQIHILDLWYERKAQEALDLILGLQARYPRNPLFRHIEAEIRDVYFHDAAGSLKASETLLGLAHAKQVNRPEIADVRARLNMARQLDRLGHHDRARAEVDAVIARTPTVPADAMARAEQLRRDLGRR